MWKPFKSDSFSIVFAFNMTPFIEEMLISGMVARATCSVQVAALTGSYEGSKENSYQLDARVVDWPVLREFLYGSNQKEILYIDVNGDVFVGAKEFNYQIDNMTKSIGKFVEVSHEIAFGLGDYTQCKETGKYYVVQRYV